MTKQMMTQQIPALLVSTILSLAPLLSLAAGDINQTAPNCSLKNLNQQETIDLQSYKGKVVYLDFWASWCGPCAESFPYMNKLDSELKQQGLEVVAINLDENPDEAQSFLKKRPARFNVALDTTEAECAKAFGVKAMPSSYLIDRKGVIRDIHYGFRNGEAQEFRAKVEKILAETQ
jgi:thiol-disulfide isomerase/thioredoxin